MNDTFKSILLLFAPDKKQTIADKEDYYPYIDGLRGVAILLVLLVHCLLCIKGMSQVFMFPYIGKFINRYGPGGVQLFFMLSAFTLFSSSKRRYTTDKYPRIDFYIRRFFRIYPLYAIAILAYTWGAPFWLTVEKLFLNLFFMPSLSYSLFWMLAVPVAWSLLCEETFYFFMPFIYTEIKTLSDSFKLFVATCLLSVGWVATATFCGIPDLGGFVSIYPFKHWFMFAAGILIYFCIKHPLFSRYVMDSARVRTPLVWFTLFIALVSVDNFYAACFALALLFTVSIPVTTIFGKIMRNKLLMRFGAYCYSIYLFHLLILWALVPLKDYVFSALGIGFAVAEIQLLVMFPIAAAICFVFAFFTFNFLEKPSVKLGKLLIPKINALLDRTVFARRQAGSPEAANIQ